MIYVLVIVIDEYLIFYYCFNGCVNDVQLLVVYLEGNYVCEELDIKIVFNKEVIKVNIIVVF